MRLINCHNLIKVCKHILFSFNYLENILLVLNSIRKVYAMAFDNRKSSQFPYSYKIHFKVSLTFSSWPLLEILPEYFGKRIVRIFSRRREPSRSFRSLERYKGLRQWETINESGCDNVRDSFWWDIWYSLWWKVYTFYQRTFKQY